MSDLISRQAAIEAIKRAIWDKYTAKDAIDAVCNIPSAEQEHATCYLDSPCEYQNINIALPSAEPEIIVKRGRWVKLDIHPHLADHKCTACGESAYVPTCMGEPMYLFCPNCGARMDEVER